MYPTCSYHVRSTVAWVAVALNVLNLDAVAIGFVRSVVLGFL